MVQNLQTEAAMKEAIKRLKDQEDREREKLTNMHQKDFAELCKDLGIFGGSKQWRVEQVLKKMVFCR